MRHIVEVYKLLCVAIFDAVFRAHVLVLMMKVLAEFSKPHGRKSLLIEGIMIAAAQESIQPEYQHWLHARIVSPSHLGDIPCQFPRPGIALPAQAANAPQFLLGRCCRYAFRKNSHSGMILLGAFVAADNVVVENRLQIPTLTLCHLFFDHLGKMTAAVQSLLFSCDGEKNN